MRKVKIFRYDYVSRSEGAYTHQTRELVEDGIGVFLEWGLDYEECNTSAGHYSVAIVERESGAVEMLHPNMIRFLREPIAKQ